MPRIGSRALDLEEAQQLEEAQRLEEVQKVEETQEIEFVEAPAQVEFYEALEDPTQTPAVGRRVPRPDTLPQVLGQLKYIDDLSFPGMLHAKVLRSQHPHARILSVDVSRAAAMPSVVATLTAEEVPVNSFGPTFQDQPILAHDKVHHMGDGVAAVAATSEQAALDALEEIVVEYEPLPAVFDPLEALEETSPKVHEPRSNVFVEWSLEKGDVDKALAESHLVLEERYTTQMVEHVPLEPHAAVALWEAGGRLTVWSTLGRISLARVDLARILAMPVHRIRVVSTQVGGNFGGKNEITFEPILALLAHKARRPVKGVYSRKEEFIASTTRHPFVMDYATGVAQSGRILARRVRLVADGGAYCSWGETTLGKATILSAGPYKIENLSVQGYAVYTNKTMTGAMRGFGAPQVCFAYESQMDNIASRLGMDPLEIRLLNAFDEGSASPTGQVLQSVVVKESLIAAAKRFGWKEWQR
jgi:CO/xanthine dehydrogenase Mo-binding subunit